jgi:hypothetical protein
MLSSLTWRSEIQVALFLCRLNAPLRRSIEPHAKRLFPGYRRVSVSERISSGVGRSGSAGGSLRGEPGRVLYVSGWTLHIDNRPPLRHFNGIYAQDIDPLCGDAQRTVGVHRCSARIHGNLP